MDIIIFSGQAGFTAKAEKILAQRNLLDRCLIVESAGKKTQEIANFYYESGAKAFIARGQNFDLIDKKYNIPVVSVRGTYEEVLVALRAAQKKSKKIAVLGYGSIFRMIQRFQTISGEDFLAVEIKDVNRIYDLVKEAIKEGVDTFVGGIATKEACDNLGVQHVMLNSDSQSIQIALDQALDLIEIQTERHKNFTLIQTILNTSEDAILGFDQDLQLNFINDKAKNLFKNRSNEMIHNLIFQPEITEKLYLDQSNLQNHLFKIDNSRHLLSIKPLTSNEKIYGVVATIKIGDDLINTEATLRQQLSEKGHVAKMHFNDIIGKSQVITETISWAKRIAISENGILIHGDTGTGKEVFAQSIHNYSSRQSGPFIAINCAALATSILESELFGYEGGSFTGANSEGKLGVFERAHKGTIFLDEIGEISGELQAKLLRVIQEKEIVRVGGNKVIPVDVRIISATNKDLKQMVTDNQFRSDLYYRLSVLELDLPALKDRKGDIPLLVSNYLVLNYPTITIEETSLNYFMNFTFEGNIRQLINLVERCVVLSDYGKISQYTVEKVCQKEFNFISATTKPSESLQAEQNKAEATLISETLQKNLGNRKKTAAELGISTTTLWRKLKKYQLINS